MALTGGGSTQPDDATFTFAHLSDIHFADYADGALFDVDSDVRGELLLDLEGLVERTGPLDAFLIGGDIAGAGQREEYEAATTWIKQLCSQFEVPVEKVYCVPGNHDVNWGVIRGDPVVTVLQDALLQCETNQFRPLLESLVTQGDHRGLVLKGLDDYNEFAAPYRCSFAPTAHKWEQVVEFGHLRIKLIGLASALVSGPSDSRTAELSRLALGPQGIIARNKNTFTIALCHHPPEWLRDRAIIEHYLKRAHLQLYGHEHSFSVSRSGAGLRVNAGAVQPARTEAKWEPSYNIIGLQASAATPLEVSVTIHARRLMGNGQFGPSDDEEEVERHSVSLSLSGATPVEAETDTVVEGSLQEMPEVSPVNERTIAQQFVALAPEMRLAIGQELGLIGIDDDALPEGDRFRQIFDVARDRDQLTALKERIENA